MANQQRGEFAIRLHGVEYGMRPTYDAVQAFEGADGMQLTQMAVAATRGGLSVRVCALIVTECVRAWGKANDDVAARGFQADTVAPILLSEGIADVQLVLADMLFLAATGGLTIEGKRKAIPTNPKAASSAVSAESPARPSGGRRPTSTRALL